MANSSRPSCEFARRSLAVLVAGAVLASARPSPAQDLAETPDASETVAPLLDPGARAKFVEALRLYQGRKLVEALAVFREIAQSTRSPNAQLYVGYCLSESGKDADAYRAFTATLRYVAERPAVKYEPTRQAAERELAVLNVRLAKITINVAQPHAGLTVTLDGVPVAPDDLGSSLVVQAGSHNVGAAATGMKPVRVAVDLDAGELRNLNLALTKMADADTSWDPPRPVPTASPVRTARPLRTVGFVAGGVGVVGVGIFAVAGLMAKSVHDELRRECGPGGCSDAAHQSEIDRSNALQTAATVGLVIGVVGVVAGGTLLVLDGKKHKESGVDLSWSAGGGVISYRGAF
jgi:hypothetical protein